jgi:WD40 repeat protein
VATFHTWEDEIYVFAAASDYTIRGWRLVTSEATFVLEGHISTVTAIEASPDPNIIAS